MGGARARLLGWVRAGRRGVGPRGGAAGLRAGAAEPCGSGVRRCALVARGEGKRCWEGAWGGGLGAAGRQPRRGGVSNAAWMWGLGERGPWGEFGFRKADAEHGMGLTWAGERDFREWGCGS